MYFKRFAQLFAIFMIASAVLALIFATNFTGNWVLTWFVATVVAYALLTLPLVVLTLGKAKKKADNVGTQASSGELARILSGLPGYIALSTGASTTIMSYIQSVRA